MNTREQLPQLNSERTFKGPELNSLKANLVRRGLTHAKLAEELRLPVSTVSKVCAGHWNSEGVRHKIEDFLGERFWSSEAEFRRRNGKPSISGGSTFET